MGGHTSALAQDAHEEDSEWRETERQVRQLSIQIAKELLKEKEV